MASLTCVSAESVIGGVARSSNVTEPAREVVDPVDDRRDVDDTDEFLGFVLDQRKSRMSARPDPVQVLLDRRRPREKDDVVDVGHDVLDGPFADGERVEYLLAPLVGEFAPLEDGRKVGSGGRPAFR